MQIGMIGLGRMGANMARRLMRDGHECVVFDRSPDAVTTLAGEGVKGADSVDALIAALAKPRDVWLMFWREHDRETVASAREADAGDTSSTAATRSSRTTSAGRSPSRSARSTT